MKFDFVHSFLCILNKFYSIDYWYALYITRILRIILLKKVFCMMFMHSKIYEGVFFVLKLLDDQHFTKSSVHMNYV